MMADIFLQADEKVVRGAVIVEAGRRVDAKDAKTARFPLKNIPEVRRKIQQFLQNEKPVAIVCSAACGTDLLLLDLAAEMQIPRYILLPSEPEEFRKSSVTDRPGDWSDLYTRMLASSQVQVLKLPAGQKGYLATNLKLLDKADAVAAERKTSVQALVIWNKESRGPDDVTGHFLDEAKLRQLPVVQISTLQ